MSDIAENAVSLDERATAAKATSEEMNRLIEDFQPFLHARVARYSNSADHHQRDELFSTAMLALYEAVNSYDAEKGHFFPFADRVVCRRLVDIVRGMYKNGEQPVPLDDFDDDDSESTIHTAAITKLSLRNYDEQRRQEQLIEEIEQFKAELSTWGITMDVLSKNSPKHKKLRDTYKQIIFHITNTADLIQTIQLKRYFPVKSIANVSGLPEKSIERARVFIIASLLIKIGDYPLLSDYVKD